MIRQFVVVPWIITKQNNWPEGIVRQGDGIPHQSVQWSPIHLPLQKPPLLGCQKMMTRTGC